MTMPSTSSVGALIEVCLAFGCKDCESVFIVLAVWYDHEKFRLLQAVEVEREVAGWVNALRR